jgi:hypothetical protein
VSLKAGLDAPAAFMNLLAPDAMVSWILLAAELAFCFAL